MTSAVAPTQNGPASQLTAPFPTRRSVTDGPRARHDARELTSGDVVAEIVLDGTVYVLRITRQGKLILTK